MRRNGLACGSSVDAANARGGPARRCPGPALALLLAALCLLAALARPAAQAAPADAANRAQEAAAALDEARREIDRLRSGLDEQREDAELAERRGLALDIQGEAQSIADSLQPQLASVAARLTELGEPPAGETEAPDVRAQRADLEKNRSELDARIKLARLLAVEAEQTAEAIAALRRERFQASLGERRPSVLGDAYWRELGEDLPRDARRAVRLWDDLGEATAATPLRVWAGIAAAMALLLALRVWAGHVLLRLSASRVPPGRLRRSFHALTVVAVWTVTPWLLGVLLHVGLDWTGGLEGDADELAGGLAGALAFGGYVAGLGQALLSPGRPSWRLPPVPDLIARRLRWFAPALGAWLIVIWLAERLPALINASLNATIAVNGVAVVLLGALMAAAARQVRRLRRRLHAEAGEQAGAQPGAHRPMPLPLAAASAAVWFILSASLLCLLVGYVALGSFALRQLAWTIVVLASAYLLAMLVEDVATALLTTAPQDESGKPMELPYARLRQQFAVLLSGAGRVAVAFLAVVLLLAPFGSGPSELLHRAGGLPAGLTIGQIALRPGALLQAAAVLVLTLAGVRLLKRWLASRYLPTTELDPGMQVSAATLFGYAGVVFAFAMALSAMGIGLERVAWIASALSVGIGFGLQAVVQNFVSGLILLAERPVKVGDWVSLGGVEGDILRINVRATEIQMSDRSTVIVPNSEFITKTVRNVTRANPLGLVQIKLPLPLDADAGQAREHILKAFEAHADVLDAPAPAVFLDSVDAQSVLLNATAFVASPRAAYGVRSAVLFDALERMRQAGMRLARTTVVANAPAPGAPPGDAPPAPRGEAPPAPLPAP